MRTRTRESAMELLEAFKADAAPDYDNMQGYRAIPTSIHPPTYFVDRVDEEATFPGPLMRQRFLRATVVVLWRQFLDNERGDAVDQLDEFIDRFADWCLASYHQPGSTELISLARIVDEPQFTINDPKRGVQTYTAARLILEGYTGN